MPGSGRIWRGELRAGFKEEELLRILRDGIILLKSKWLCPIPLGFLGFVSNSLCISRQIFQTRQLNAVASKWVDQLAPLPWWPDTAHIQKEVLAEQAGLSAP